MPPPPREGSKVKIDIECQAVESDAVANGDADAAQLVVVHPDTMIARIASGGYPAILGQAQHQFLQQPDITTDAEPAFQSTRAPLALTTAS